jgi:hypothetical protein
MSLVTGFELALLVVALGALGLTAFALYLRNRHDDTASLALDVDDALCKKIDAIAAKLRLTDQQAVHFAINRLHAELLLSSDEPPAGIADIEFEPPRVTIEARPVDFS